MAAENLGEKLELTYSGYIDWPGFYGTLKKWMKGELLKIYEPLYKNKTGGDGYTERELKWICEKKVDRLNKYIMTVELKMWDVQPVEITQNGETKTVDRGRIRVFIQGSIDEDYQGKFGSSNFLKAMWKMYRKLIRWEWGFSHWDYWYNKQFELRDALRKTLGVI